MELQHIDLNNLKTTALNVRKKGAKDVADLLPSIRSLGVLQPLLVRPNCEGYEIVAGQRRYHALVKLSEETAIDPVPCIIMDDGDDAKAIEASLAENIARLPMDEIDQYKAFSALIKQNRSVADIASQFGITERLVQQRLAIANLIDPLLTLYRKQEIKSDTVRVLTMATKRQQKAWAALYKSEDDYAPLGGALKEWLFGGASIPVSNALFDMDEYKGSIISDLFGEERYFSDSEAFWTLQNRFIAKTKQDYLAKGWADVILLDKGVYWSSWEYSRASKKEGGVVFVHTTRDGEVTFHAGYLTAVQARRVQKSADGETQEKTPERSELTKSMQNYLDLHRHAAVRADLLNHSAIALRLCVAQIIAGSDLWAIQADPQKANTEAITQSLTDNKAEDFFAKEREIIRDFLGCPEEEDATVVPARHEWGRQIDLCETFARLIALDDATVTRILTFVVAETLPSGNAIVEVLGTMLSVDMATNWQVDDIFLDLLRDKQAINGMVHHIGGKDVADGNISATAKVQKQIIADYLNGTRKPHATDWHPRYMDFPMKAYTKRGGIAAIEKWDAVAKHFG